jgi:hypothetical protein
MLLSPPSTPWSDYEAVLFRYDAFVKGAMSFWDFIFIKHGGHNHAFIFFLGLLDIWIDHGKLWLFSWAVVFSNLAVFGIYVYLIRTVITDKLLRFVATAFIASQIFSMQGGEIWAVSFQAVVTCFRLFLVAGLWMFCRALLKLEQKKGARLSLIISLFILFVASVSHGSGILVPPLLLALYAFVYIKGDYPVFQKKAIFPILLLSLVFLIHETLYPSHDLGFAAVLKNVPFAAWDQLPRYLAFMLGHFFVWNLGESITLFMNKAGLGNFSNWDLVAFIQKVIGAVGMLIFLGVGCKVLIKRPTTATSLLFLSLGFFSLGAALMGIVFNLGQIDARGISLDSLDFLKESRYIFMPTGFWIATIVLLFSELEYFSRQRGYQKIISKVIATVTMLIVLFSAGCSVGYSFREVDFWSQYLHSLFKSEKIIATDAWQSIPVATLNDAIIGLAGHATYAKDRIEVLRKYSLGPYAKSKAYYEKHDFS